MKPSLDEIVYMTTLLGLEASLPVANAQKKFVLLDSLEKVMHPAIVKGSKIRIIFLRQKKREKLTSMKRNRGCYKLTRLPG